jgi:hypothetical protein
LNPAIGRSGLLAAFLVPAALAAAWTVVAGKDVSWDLLNYHYYIPYEWLEGRLRQDYFAASAQSYLNPLGHLPFYLMVSAGWHSVVVSIVLAAAHATCISLLYLIAFKLFAHHPMRERHVLAALSSALAASSAIFWATVGSSFLDPLLVAPMLAGLLLLLGGDAASAAPRVFAAGLLFGTAAALKYSNGIFALAAAPLALAMPGARGTGRMWAALAYAGGGVLAVAALAGPWMLLMWREFGNPVFPLMNGWFRSPDAPLFNMESGRFAVRDLGAALAFPFRMLMPDRTLYAEITAPDLRFAPLLVAALALPVNAWLRTRRGAVFDRLSALDWRLLGFFFLALLGWLATSANGRYGMVVLLLAGLCLGRLTEHLLPPRAARIALAVLLIAQITACTMVSAPRWFIAERWSRQWLPFEVPQQATGQPALYLSLETLPMAAAVPSFHPESSFVNLRGQYSIAPGAPRLEALFERHRDRVRVLGRILQLREDGKPREGVVSAYDSSLIRFGYRIDTAQCFSVRWAPDDADALSRLANRLMGRQADHQAALSMASCALLPAKREPAHIEEERRVSASFDRIEKACADLLRGHTALTEALGEEWMRNYPGLDARLQTHRGRMIFERYLVLQYFDLGPLADWERGDAVLPAACL